MKQVTADVWIDRADLSSIQKEEVWRHEAPTSPSSDGHSYLDFRGSVITLKNGRKIFIRDMSPDQIMEKLA